MRYAELGEKNATKREIQEYLADGEATTITLRIPGNLHESAKEAAALRGMRLLTAEAPDPLDPHAPLPGAVVEVPVVVAVMGVVAGRAAARARLLRGLAAPLALA